MTQVTAVHKTQHKDVKIRTDLVEAQSAALRMVPLIAQEFSKAATEYPVVLVKDPETGVFGAIALLGFDEGENLFWKADCWDAIYVPLTVRRHPFFLGRDQNNGEDSYSLCIDVKSPCLSDTEGEALFLEDGSPSPYLDNIQSMMSSILDGEDVTRTFIGYVADLGLLTEVALDITFNNGEKQRVNGLYSIDEEKLSTLDDAAFLDLRRAGYLPLIYAMIVSLGQIYALIEKKNAMHARAQEWFDAPQP